MNVDGNKGNLTEEAAEIWSKLNPDQIETFGTDFEIHSHILFYGHILIENTKNRTGQWFGDQDWKALAHLDCTNIGKIVFLSERLYLKKCDEHVEFLDTDEFYNNKTLCIPLAIFTEEFPIAVANFTKKYLKNVY